MTSRTRKLTVGAVVAGAILLLLVMGRKSSMVQPAVDPRPARDARDGAVEARCSQHHHALLP